MARVTEEDKEREITIEWTETVYKSLTLDFAKMAKTLKISQSALRDWLDEGEEKDLPANVQAQLSHHSEMVEEDDDWELTSIDG